MRFRMLSVILTLALTCTSVFSSQGTDSRDGTTPSIPEVIRRFAEAETQNRIARNNYMFTQDFELTTYGEAGSITGKFHRISEIVFDDRSNRFEKITFFPPSTAKVDMTTQDMQDMAGVQPFALTTEDLPKYQIDYVGKEKIDELNTYIFEVKPKAIRKDERYLEGRIWVDDQDFQIVKVAGRAVPQFDDNRFPKFETYRENIDGRYWFPTYTYADDVLEFKKGPSIHLRMVVRYANYKKFAGKIRIADEGEAVSEEEVKAAEKNKTVKPVKPPEQPESKPEPKRPPQRP